MANYRGRRLVLDLAVNQFMTNQLEDNTSSCGFVQKVSLLYEDTDGFRVSLEL